MTGSLPGWDEGSANETDVRAPDVGDYLVQRICIGEALFSSYLLEYRIAQHFVREGAEDGDLSQHPPP